MREDKCRDCKETIRWADRLWLENNPVIATLLRRKKKDGSEFYLPLDHKRYEAHKCRYNWGSDKPRVQIPKITGGLLATVVDCIDAYLSTKEWTEEDWKKYHWDNFVADVKYRPDEIPVHVPFLVTKTDPYYGKTNKEIGEIFGIGSD